MEGNGSSALGMITLSQNLYLIGFMASGKSRQGQLLAARIGCPFRDTDAMIREQEGMSVSEIFAARGEPYFREQELRTVETVSGLTNHVVALGGGTPAQEAVWPALRRSGKSIYLKRSPRQLLHQLRKFENRPLLRGIPDSEKPAHITKMLADREAWYNRADLIFPCKDGWSREETAEHLYAFLENNL